MLNWRPQETIVWRWLTLGIVTPSDDCVGTLISCGTLLEVVTLGILLANSFVGFSATIAAAMASNGDVPVSSLVSALALAIGSNGFGVVNWRTGSGVPLSQVTAVGSLTCHVPSWGVGFHSSPIRLCSLQFRFVVCSLQLAGDQPSSFSFLSSSCVIKCFRTIKSKA